MRTVCVKNIFALHGIYNHRFPVAAATTNIIIFVLAAAVLLYYVLFNVKIRALGTGVHHLQGEDLHGRQERQRPDMQICGFLRKALQSLAPGCTKGLGLAALSALVTAAFLTAAASFALGAGMYVCMYVYIYMYVCDQAEHRNAPVKNYTKGLTPWDEHAGGGRG